MGWLRHGHECETVVVQAHKGFLIFHCALSDFLRTYHNVPHMVTKRTPAEVIFGQAPHTHLSMVLPNITEHIR